MTEDQGKILAEEISKLIATHLENAGDVMLSFEVKVSCQVDGIDHILTLEGEVTERNHVH